MSVGLAARAVAKVLVRLTRPTRISAEEPLQNSSVSVKLPRSRFYTHPAPRPFPNFLTHCTNPRPSHGDLAGKPRRSYYADRDRRRHAESHPPVLCGILLAAGRLLL